MNAATPSRTNYRWVICGLLFFATTINYADRQILSLLKPMLDDRLHWSSAQFGAINAAFQAAYGVSLFIFGWLIDRWGTKVGYAISIALWSVAAMGHALVGSISGFLLARIALGLGEGGNFPAAIKATAQWFPRKERALSTSIFNSGANVGAIVAPMLVPPIAYTLGWHWAFVFAGMAGILWLVAWWPLFNSPERSRRVSTGELDWIKSDPPDAGAPGERVRWRQLLRYPQAWSFITAKFLTDPVWWFFLIWLPDFFNKNRHLDIKGSWPLLVSIYAIVTVLSIAGGWFTGFLAQRGWSITAARKTGLLIFAVSVVPIVFVSHANNWTAVALIGLAGAAHQAWSANLFTTVSDMFPKRAVASLVGIGGTAGSIGGMIFPISVGLILDHFAKTGYSIVFGFCSVAYLVAFAINHLLARSFEPIDIDIAPHSAIEKIDR